MGFLTPLAHPIITLTSSHKISLNNRSVPINTPPQGFHLVLNVKIQESSKQ